MAFIIPPSGQHPVQRIEERYLWPFLFLNIVIQCGMSFVSDRAVKTQPGISEFFCNICPRISLSYY